MVFKCHAVSQKLFMIIAHNTTGVSCAHGAAVYHSDKIKFKITWLLFIKMKFTNFNLLNHLTNISMNWLAWLQIIIMLFRLLFCFYWCFKCKNAFTVSILFSFRMRENCVQLLLNLKTLFFSSWIGKFVLSKYLQSWLNFLKKVT